MAYLPEGWPAALTTRRARRSRAQGGLALVAIGATLNPSASNLKSSTAPQGWHDRGYLPHFDRDIIQLVTFRLYDSLPKKRLEQWREQLGYNRELCPTSEQAVKLRKKIDLYEDAGHGCCWLSRPSIACMVQEALQHHHNQRYVLIAWCIMPNHVHALIKILPEHSLTSIVHSWKSFTAHQANQLLRRKGIFWQLDYHDRYIRDDEHYRNAINYIHNNPVKAGLVATAEQWLYSSAYGVSRD